MENGFYRMIAERLSNLESTVLAMVVSRSGSAPREAGAAMAVFLSGETRGTVGGGPLEARVIKAALDVFSSGRSVCLKYTLTDLEKTNGGMICGGQVEVLLNYLDGRHFSTNAVMAKAAAACAACRTAWLVLSFCREDSASEHGKTGWGILFEDQADAGSLDLSGCDLARLKEACRPDGATALTGNKILYLIFPAHSFGRVIIVGAGHVGQELAVLCSRLSLYTLVIDDRPDYAHRDRFPAAEIVIAQDSFENCFAGLSISVRDRIVIVTRGHEHDRRVLAQAIKSPAGYIGMMASLKKRNTIYDGLRQDGVTKQDLARVHSPVGLSIGARTPAEIAVSIAAELIALRNSTN
ncbi:MAG TPA: XdhC family protein [Smithellaceae bacterium]|nr:XdhC family protein [Smithellaceae bacterium]HQM44481.1 XdhC family protein [Smithellaceae bacterium]